MNDPKQPTPALAAAALAQTAATETPLSDIAPDDLKKRTAHGAVVSIGAQVATFILRTGSMMAMARLVLPREFGLVAMVAAFTGFLGLFRDAGLSMAMVQRDSITHGQASTLFWVNIAVGGILSAACVIAAPIVSAFYSEPRLFWVTIALGLNFLLNGAAAQHRAMLQRSMRFGTMVATDVAALLTGTAVGIGMALAGFGYWALVFMTIAQTAGSLTGLWLTLRWVPGRPQRGSGIKSMLVFGGTVTLNNVIMYVAYNTDKVLLGFFHGAEALGIYGRAYQLINLPTENINSTFGAVAFPAMSRLQNDPDRLRRYFLKGYDLFLALVMPITMGCALFADDIVRVFLGKQWTQAAGVFRLMAPTIVAFALINPLGWMMLAGGRALRSLKIAFVIAPVVILSYVIGLEGGPNGVAAGFSIAMVILVFPVVLWATRDTRITGIDIIKSISRPLISIMAGTVAAWFAKDFINGIGAAFPRLVLNSLILFGVYALVLLFVMGQKEVYMQIIRETGLLRPSADIEKH